MAIESSNRSPSPMSARPNPNFANSSNHSEKRCDGSVRRSVNGSPFPKPSMVAHPTPWSFKSKTQANGSAVIGRRNSFGSTGLSRENNEHKENNKPNAISKPARGSKNFMSPTISAASKINASPRKKVLAERNEAVRTSASLSDGKFLFFAASEENDEFRAEIDKKEETRRSSFESRKRVTFDDDVVVLSPKELSISDAKDPFDSNDFAEDEANETCLSDISKASTTLVSSPLPVSPLDADPFALPYDPKTNYLSPRPQFLRYQPLNLEDTFSSETSSEGDNESTLEEVQSKEVSVQEESLSSSFSSSSDVSVQTHQSEEASAESEALSKPRSFTIRRAISWFLLLGLVTLLAGVIVSRSPENAVVSPSYQALSKMYDDYKPYEALAVAGLGGLLRKMKTGSVNLPLTFFGITEADNRFIASHFLNISEFECAASDRFIEATSISLLETEMGSTSKEVAIFQDSKLPDQHIGDFSEESELVESFAISEPYLGVDHEEFEVQDELLKPDNSKESQHDPIVEEQQNLSDGILEEDEAGLADLEELDSHNTIAESVKQEGLVSENQNQIDGANRFDVLIASLCLAIAITGLIVFTISKKNAKSVSTEQSEKPMKEWEVVELDGGTCPSELSSFSSYQKRSESEAQSKGPIRQQQQRRNIRRESLASSSTEYTRGSSYGSFTTYSIMPTKQGDEEIVTPVRRSNRIRQKVTPP